MKPPSEAPSIPRASRAQGLSRPSSKSLLDCAANTLCEWGVGNYWLHDDYVKFIAFAQKKMDEVEEGIVGVITNHNYLDGPTFRGMCQNLMMTFNRIIILDLHGSVQRIENIPNGTIDQNVFDIRPGVAIALLVKNRKIGNSIEHDDLWGKREDKYNRLAHSTLSDFEWRRIRPRSPNYFFEEGINGKECENGRPLDQMFTISSTALQTSRDELATAQSEIDLVSRLADLRDASKPDDQFRHLLKKKKGSQLSAGDSSFWNLKDARKKLQARPSIEIVPLLY